MRPRHMQEFAYVMRQNFITESGSESIAKIHVRLKLF